jgi:hypothetical protein
LSPWKQRYVATKPLIGVVRAGRADASAALTISNSRA